MLHIDSHPAAAWELPAEDQVHEVLERHQRVATASNEQPEVFALDIQHCQHGAKPVARRKRLANRDFGIDIEDSKQVIHRLRGEIHFWRVDVGCDFRFVIPAPAFARWARALGSRRTIATVTTIRAFRTIATVGASATSLATTTPARCTLARFASPGGAGWSSSTAAPEEVCIRNARLNGFQACSAASAAASGPSRATIAAAFSWRTSGTWPAIAVVAATPLTAATFATPRNARISRAGGRGGRALAASGYPRHANTRVLRAAAEEATALSFIQHYELDVFTPGSELR